MGEPVDKLLPNPVSSLYYHQRPGTIDFGSSSDDSLNEERLWRGNPGYTITMISTIISSFSRAYELDHPVDF